MNDTLADLLSPIADTPVGAPGGLVTDSNDLVVAAPPSSANVFGISMISTVILLKVFDESVAIPTPKMAALPSSLYLGVQGLPYNDPYFP